MKKSIHYLIDDSRVSESKPDVRQAMKRGSKILKIVRIEYQTGPTKTILTTATEITKPKKV